MISFSLITFLLLRYPGTARFSAAVRLEWRELSRCRLTAQTGHLDPTHRTNSHRSARQFRLEFKNDRAIHIALGYPLYCLSKRTIVLTACALTTEDLMLAGTFPQAFSDSFLLKDPMNNASLPVRVSTLIWHSNDATNFWIFLAPLTFGFFQHYQ